MAHVNEARQLTYLGMVHSEPLSTGTGIRQPIQGPAIAQVDMIMEIGFRVEAQPMFRYRDGRERTRVGVAAACSAPH